ncbi:MAG: hypothetical protein C0403_16850 [Desulfobacterium sp.]|nr:hypothetical protein [Desulfobacterium sp.]
MIICGGTKPGVVFMTGFFGGSTLKLEAGSGGRNKPVPVHLNVIKIYNFACFVKPYFLKL